MRTTIKKIGNSKGVLLPPAFLAKLNLEKDSIIDIDLISDRIIIQKPVNPRSEWELQFKKAIDNGETPENDLFKGMSNELDDKEWIW